MRISIASLSTVGGIVACCFGHYITGGIAIFIGVMLFGIIFEIAGELFEGFFEILGDILGSLFD